MPTRVPELLLEEEADPGHSACLMPVVIPELVVVAIAAFRIGDFFKLDSPATAAGKTFTLNLQMLRSLHTDQPAPIHAVSSVGQGRMSTDEA